MRAPVETFLSFTTKCNLKCKHCYSNSGISGSTVNVEKLLGILSKIKPLRIIISGGDPLIEFNKLLDFLERLYLLNEGNAKIVIATNGTLLTSERLKKLSKYVDRYQISLDTLSEEKYVRIRGVDLLKKSIEGIKLAVKGGYDIQIAFSIFKENIIEIEDIINFCVENKISKINVLRPRPLGRLDENLTREEIIEAYTKFSKLCKEKNINLFLHDPIANSLGFVSECSAATDTVAIDMDLKFKPCPLFDKGLACEFKEAWNSDFFNQVREDIEQCKGCKVGSCNGGCRACHWNIYDKPGRDPSCLIK